MRTPPESASPAATERTASATPRVPLSQVESSASPPLQSRRDRSDKMKRTPQPTFTQSKLTSLLQPQAKDGSHSKAATPTPTVSLESLEMHTSGPTDQPPATTGDTRGPASGTVVTTDFLLKALKENTDHLLHSFDARLGAVAEKVGRNTAKIDAHDKAIKLQDEINTKCREDLLQLTDRVRVLEEGKPAAQQNEERVALSDDYLLARRTARLWPVVGTGLNELWGEVGEFLHGLLGIPEDDLNQNDIENICVATPGPFPGPVHDEVLVTFKDKKKRDLVMASSANLANAVDALGKPTAGTRIEVPPQLDDVFRLLSRFGTRLRARHGKGTRRHIKFDDYLGSLYCNVKLPGDVEWTRVSPDMARADLEASTKEVNAAAQARLAAKLIPGPRERLQAPAVHREARSVISRPRPTDDTHRVGKRPRWAGPDKPRPTV